jgi:phosphoglycolate phosphatase
MARTASLRFVAFDLDGTLIDSASTIVASVLACWDACGFPEPTPESVRRIIGLPWEDSVRALLPGAGEPEFARIRTYHEEVRQGLRARPDRTEAPFPGALDLLARLQEQDYLIGLVTSRANNRLGELLEKHGLGGCFVTRKTADMGPGKPNPHLLIAAMDELGVSRDRTVMIGDTTFDVLMARNAGAAAVGVSWGVHDRDELIAAGAHRIAEAFDDLPSMIEALTGLRRPKPVAPATGGRRRLRPA